MSLQNDIKEDLMRARYAKNSTVVKILSTLLGEASIIGKSKRNGESTDEEVVSVVKKFLMGIDENLKMHEFINEESEMCISLRYERDLINKYMPQQLSESELKTIIQGIIKQFNLNSIRQVGLVMGELKKNYSARYDGTVAIQLVKESLV
jgi:uncharacterized protein YqeY